jgi:hypothetical protein
MKIEITVSNDLNDHDFAKNIVQQLYEEIGTRHSILAYVVQELRALQHTLDNETWQKALEGINE